MAQHGKLGLGANIGILLHRKFLAFLTDRSRKVDCRPLRADGRDLLGVDGQFSLERRRRKFPLFVWRCIYFKPPFVFSGSNRGKGTVSFSIPSSVRIAVEVRGDCSPPIPYDSLSVPFRTGVDLNPVDVTDPDAALWLRAPVWPGHERRADQLQVAVSLAVGDPPALVAGNGLIVLPTILGSVPARSTLCIFS